MGTCRSRFERKMAKNEVEEFISYSLGFCLCSVCVRFLCIDCVDGLSSILSPKK